MLGARRRNSVKPACETGRVRATLLLLKIYVMNHLVNRVPFVAFRQRAYAALGVQLEDPGTGMIMLGTIVNDPGELRIGSNCVIGRDCVLDARGGIELGRSREHRLGGQPANGEAPG